MALPVSFSSMTINDNTINQKTGEPESTNWSVPVTTLTAANYVAKKALIDDLNTAVDSIIIGMIAKKEVVIDRTLVSALPAASTLAQRENKWLLRYVDTVTSQKFRVSIGTADLTELPDNSEFLDLTAGDGLALKTAFDAIVVSPDNSSNAVSLRSVQFVGRNT